MTHSPLKVLALSDRPKDRQTMWRSLDIRVHHCYVCLLGGTQYKNRISGISVACASFPTSVHVWRTVSPSCLTIMLCCRITAGASPSLNCPADLLECIKDRCSQC